MDVMTKYDAETQIGVILKQLEIDTGALVDKIVIGDVDITGPGDENPQVQTRVAIEMIPIPGRRW